MIVGVGVDIVRVERMEEAIDRGRERLLERLFTTAEREDATGVRATERLAARFAAKEAALKALGTGWSGGVAWKDVEVVREPSGQTRLRITGRAAELADGLGVTRSHLSLSHQAGWAVAMVVLEKDT